VPKKFERERKDSCDGEQWLFDCGGREISSFVELYYKKLKKRECNPNLSKSIL
jgi:hypothetical protein